MIDGVGSCVSTPYHVIFRSMKVIHMLVWLVFELSIINN